MDARTLGGCVRLRRRAAGTVTDMTVKCESEGWGEAMGRVGWGLFMSYGDRKKERLLNVSGLVPRLQQHFCNKIHLILYGAGK